jgi:hypothetical protein
MTFWGLAGETTMRSLITFLFGCAVVCGLAVPAVQADDKVDSPIYKHWAKFKPGAFSVVKTIRSAKGIKAEITATTTLKEVTPEKVVVELQIVTLGSEEKMEMVPRKQAYPARIEKDEARKMEDPKKGDKVENAEVLDVEQGKEEIKVGDKKIKCKWLETRSKQDDQTAVTKVWTSDEVPGQVVKMVVTTKGGAEMTSETSLLKYSPDGGTGADKTERAGSEKDKEDKKDEADKKNESEKKEQKDKT